MPIRRAPVTALLLATALLATGCGGSSGSSGSAAGGTSGSPAVSSLLSAMTGAFDHAQAVHVAGNITQQGKMIQVDLDITKSGDMSGTLSVNGVGFYVLISGQDSYVKLNQDFLNTIKAPAGVCAKVCGKYVTVNGGFSLPAMAQSFSWHNLIEPLRYGPGVAGTVISGETTVNGQRAWVLKASGGVTANIAASGTAYLLRLISPPGQGSGKFDFTHWNAVIIPASPPASDVVDLASLNK